MGQNQRSQIEMTPDEVAAFLNRQRTGTFATVGSNGAPHLVAMWFGLIDGDVWFETKAKSQKAANLRRNPHLTFMVKDGLTYDTLRGVSLEGRGEISDDAELLWKLGVNVFERYNGPYTEETRPFVEAMLHKRVAVRLDVERARSWDHRKLGLPPMPLGGTTAEHADR